MDVLNTVSTLFSGSYAQYLAVNEAWLTLIPNQLSSEQAGATPLVALTAFQVQHSYKYQ